MTNPNPFRRRTAAAFLLSSAALAFLGPAAFAQAERKNDPGAFAPPDALVLLGVTDLDQFIDGFKKSSGYKVLNDPAFKDAPGQFNMVNRLLEEFAKRLGKALDTESEKLKNPFGGTLALMVLPPAGDAKEPSLVLVAGVKDKSLMREYYTKAVANFKKIADAHESVDFAGSVIDHFTTRDKPDDKKDAASDADSDPNSLDMSREEDVAQMMDKIFGQIFSSDALPESFATYLSDERLVVAFSPDDVKGVFRREKGGETLRDNEDYKSIGRHFESPGPVRVFVNLPKVLEIARAENPEGFKETMNLLGGKCMRGFIAHAGYSTGKFDMRAEAMLLTSGDRTGLMKILSPKNRPVAAPEGLSADTAVSISAAINLADTIDEIERMIRADDPEAADQMRASLDNLPMGEGEKISPRKDVIENLREPLTFAFGFAKPYTPDSPRFTLSVGHRNKQALTRVIEKIQTLAQMEAREVRGSAIYDAPAPFKLSVALTNETVIFGSTNSVEESLQTARDAGLAADATFKRTLELAPKEAWLAVYADGKRLYEAIAELAKYKTEMMRQMFTTGNIGAGFAYGMAESFSPGEADNSAAMRRLAEHQAAGMVTVTTTSDGIRISILNLVQEK